MSPETKKYLIYGTFIVVAAGVGVFVWKKYQDSSSASSAAEDQSNQDELALLSSALESNAYAGSGSGGDFTSTVATGTTSQTLAQEILALEQALGIPVPTITQTPASPTSGSTGGSGTSGSSGSGTGTGTGTGTGSSSGTGTSSGSGGGGGGTQAITGKTINTEDIWMETPTYETDSLSSQSLEYAETVK
jgi:hypothetical protein